MSEPMTPEEFRANYTLTKRYCAGCKQWFDDYHPTSEIDRLRADNERLVQERDAARDLVAERDRMLDATSNGLIAAELMLHNQRQSFAELVAGLRQAAQRLSDCGYWGGADVAANLAAKHGVPK